ncbi:hypothetical protein [Pseudokordiimonas caeni]|uniref:hypothetical protein n=1 Tax=Pseudokordiimonas caeni TaxID=2997908 RepID=UPI00281133A1|nr:hypothetical protein [Pseudokordiimonas caeni]
MASPLPKDVEQSIAGNALRAEVRSVAFMAFVLGIAVGFGIGAAVFADSGARYYFVAGALVIGLLWFLAARARRGKPN